jgi:hypothetical protein
MELMSSLDIPGRPGRRIELLQGDLTVPDPRHPFDLLVVSAFPDDYLPTPGSLIGALNDAGVSVQALAGARALDLRTHFSCWLSHDLPAAGPGFRRLLCFEPGVRGSPPEVVADIFRSLMPILGDHPGLRIAAMPVVAAGDQSWPVSAILPPLLDAALHWLQVGLPLDVLRIVAHGAAEAQAAKTAFDEFAAAQGVRSGPVAIPGSTSGAAAALPSHDHDIFLSYAREDEDAVRLLRSLILARAPQTRVFLDRNSIAVGAAWQAQIFEALDRCRKVVAMLSPSYVQSKVCKDEFNIAWAISRNTEVEVLFPIYLRQAPLPTYMKMLSFVDCRDGGPDRMDDACTALLASLG